MFHAKLDVVWLYLHIYVWFWNQSEFLVVFKTNGKIVNTVRLSFIWHATGMLFSTRSILISTPFYSMCILVAFLSPKLQNVYMVCIGMFVYMFMFICFCLYTTCYGIQLFRTFCVAKHLKLNLHTWK